MKYKDKKEILDTISKLLDGKDCTVRIQREILPSPTMPTSTGTQTFIPSKRLKIIVVGTHT
jgi:hypothetical protein